MFITANATVILLAGVVVNVIGHLAAVVLINVHITHMAVSVELMPLLGGHAGAHGIVLPHQAEQ